MDLFQTEQSRVEKILEENYLIALQELGLEGHYVFKSLSEAKEIVEGSRSNPEPCKGEAKVLLAKNLLKTYSENASVLIKRITGVLTQIRQKTTTLWIPGAPLSGRTLLLFLLFTGVAIAVSWALHVTAIICDNEVTGAFMANALLTRQFPFYCLMLSNRDLLYQNKTELILYIARQSNIAIAAKRFYRGLSLIFLLCVVYSFFRNAVERQFRVTAEGQKLIAEDAKAVLIRWLLEHGYQTPGFLNSRLAEVEYLLESTRFQNKDSRSESEYDELSGSEDEEGEDENESVEKSTSPEPDLSSSQRGQELGSMVIL